MKKALPALFLILMLAGSVSAAEVSYRPNKDAFVKFLDSNLTYQVVPATTHGRGDGLFTSMKSSPLSKHTETIPSFSLGTFIQTT